MGGSSALIGVKVGSSMVGNLKFVGFSVVMLLLQGCTNVGFETADFNHSYKIFGTNHNTGINLYCDHGSIPFGLKDSQQVVLILKDVQSGKACGYPVNDIENTRSVDLGLYYNRCTKDIGVPDGSVFSVDIWGYLHGQPP